MSERYRRPVVYAGFLPRLAATLIDSMLLSVVLLPLPYILFTLFHLVFGIGDGGGQGIGFMTGFWGSLLFFDLLPMVLIIFFWIRFRSTPGHRLMNCEIVDASSLDNLTVLQSIIRYIGYFLSALPLFLGFFWVIWNPQRRGFHDMLARSVVIRVNRNELSELPLEKLMRDVE